MQLFRTFPKQIMSLALLVMVLAGFGYLVPQNRGPGCGITVYEGEPSSVNFLNQFRPRSCVFLERADTPGSRARGLSGRVSMDKTSGMLFVFDHPQQVCIWMKDMKFPLDLLWLDTDHRIVKTKANVSPETYPETFCVDNVQYVIELKAGVASQA
jgi:uncharacterized membrane protein (UPF0127 family)